MKNILKIFPVILILALVSCAYTPPVKKLPPKKEVVVCKTNVVCLTNKICAVSNVVVKSTNITRISITNEVEELPWFYEDSTNVATSLTNSPSCQTALTTNVIDAIPNSKEKEDILWYLFFLGITILCGVPFYFLISYTPKRKVKKGLKKGNK